MSNFSLVSPLDSIANAAAAAQRSAINASSGSASTSGNVVQQAQAESAADATQTAQANAANAASTSALAKAGVTESTVSFVDLYKNQLLQAVDPNGTGSVSESALEQQVVAGGGTQAQANTLYKALDQNGDGIVSDQEFENGIPDPFTSANFAQQFLAMLQQTDQTKSGGSAPTLDSSMILANLAIEQSQSSAS